MAARIQFQGLKDALDEGIESKIESLCKWYGHAEDTSPAYFICLVLDPNVKDLYFRGRWNSEQYATGMNQLEEVVSHVTWCKHWAVLFTDPCLRY
jgi:hypothetical protein